MFAMASQITSFAIVYSTVSSGADQRKHRSSASLAFVWGIHLWIPRTKASNAGNVSIWWRHDMLIGSTWSLHVFLLGSSFAGDANRSTYFRCNERLFSIPVRKKRYPEIISMGKWLKMPVIIAPKHFRFSDYSHEHRQCSDSIDFTQWRLYKMGDILTIKI